MTDPQAGEERRSFVSYTAGAETKTLYLPVGEGGGKQVGEFFHFVVAHSGAYYAVFNEGEDDDDD